MRANDTQLYYQFQGYQPLGVYIVLVGVEVWNTGDKITVNTLDPEFTLEEWSTYRMTYINPFHYNDNGVLITYVILRSVVCTSLQRICRRSKSS